MIDLKEIKNFSAELREQAEANVRAADLLDALVSNNHSARLGRPRRRHLSNEAKRRISEMMKKNWARRKRAAKKAAGKVTHFPGKKVAA